MKFLRGFTVTVVRPPEPVYDPYGDPTPGEPVRTELTGVGLAPRTGGPGTASTDIENRGREGLRSGLTMYAEVGADIRRHDLVVVDEPGFEGTYKVDGEPLPWVSPFDGWRAGIEVALTRAEG